MAVLLLRQVVARQNAVIWAHPDSSTRGERLEIVNSFDLLRHTLGCGGFGDHQVGHCSQDRAYHIPGVKASSTESINPFIGLHHREHLQAVTRLF